MLASLSWFDELTMRACGDCSEAFELAEEALDEVAFAIECEVASPCGLSVGLWWDHRGDAAPVESVEQRISVVSLVTKQGLRIDAVDQRLRAG